MALHNEYKLSVKWTWWVITKIKVGDEVRGGEVGSMDLKGVEGRIEGEYDKTHHMVFSKN